MSDARISSGRTAAENGQIPAASAGTRMNVLVIGLDGATFDLMLPWIAEGRLPHLARLVREGVRGTLQSTLPPITPCAWSSMMTGKNPGKHGLLDFVEPIPTTHGFRFTNASTRQGETIWSIANRHDIRVGAINVPMTFPPEPVQGYMISGLDTPHEKSAYIYPASLRQELKQQAIDYKIDQQHLGNMRSDARRQRQLAAIFAAESARTATFRYLHRRDPVSLRMIVYGATDQVQHHFWHYMDPSHDKYDARGAQRFAHAIRDTYCHIDEQIGLLLSDCDESTNIIVMSDHGFGPTSNVRLRLNQLLEQHGLLTFQRSPAASRSKRIAMSIVDRLLRSTLSSDAKRALAGRFPWLRLWFERQCVATIDWSKTVAFVNEIYRSSPAVWINRGLGLSDEAIRETCDKVESLLKSLTDPLTGKPVIRAVARPRSEYVGPFFDKAPDLLPSWWEDGFLLDQSEPGADASTNVTRSTTPVEGGVEFAGSHRMDGVFIAWGPAMRRHEVMRDARIIDIAPTILHLLGIPIPSDMDGKVLSGCLREEYLHDNPLQFCEADTRSHQSATPARSFSDEEEACIADRLRALGYIS